MSALLDRLLTPEQRASCAKYDGPPSDIMAMDVSRFPPSAAFGDECAAEGAAPVVSYDVGRIQAVSNADPWLWRLAPVAIVVGALWSAWEVAGRPVLW